MHGQGEDSSTRFTNDLSPQFAGTGLITIRTSNVVTCFGTYYVVSDSSFQGTASYSNGKTANFQFISRFFKDKGSESYDGKAF